MMPANTSCRQTLPWPALGAASQGMRSPGAEVDDVVPGICRGECLRAEHLDGVPEPYDLRRAVRHAHHLESPIAQVIVGHGICLGSDGIVRCPLDTGPIVVRIPRRYPVRY